MKRFAVLAGLLLTLVAILPIAAQTELTALVGMALPPYILQDTNDGMEVDILRAALAPSNYKIKLQYVPFARVPVGLANKTADCALTINESSGVKGVFYSDSHVAYQNVVVALKSRNLKIKSASDLKGLKIEAFQDANIYLGPEYSAAIKGNPGYVEIADQSAQVKLLFAGRVDVVVMEINIFKYFRQMVKDLDVSQDVTIYEIFPPTNYKVAFTNKDICDKFNVGLKKLKDSGEYQAIFKKYIK